jgi:hypothetical protein
MFLKLEAKLDMVCIMVMLRAIRCALSQSKMTSLPLVNFSSVALSLLTVCQNPLTRPLRKECARGMRKKVVGLHQYQGHKLKVSQKLIGANTDAPRDKAFPVMIMDPSLNNNRDCRIVHYRSVYIVIAIGQGPACYKALQGVRKGIA